ncbi:hypothetical protein FNW25_01435 [Flavobacterium franklandianum]|uniref:hypothetical protein n=1 Tax=Flavobacterium franklandianum TaxID=2594430 RepID=UPI00117B76B1|nr:hypothetical protein [Flavobacterium franklandianum]TRX29649.1 hypothetical protein FNW25_01435 [Flavobacterium franklandianum]
MISRNARTQSPVGSGFFGFIERYFAVILGLIIALPFLYRFFQNENTKTEVNEVEEQIKLNNVVNLSPITQLDALNKVSKNQSYHNWARSLANNFGTLQLNQNHWYDWANPKTWTENDTDLYNSLKQITNTGQKRILSELYFILTARNLSTDVSTLLDKNLLIKLPLFK